MNKFSENLKKLMEEAGLSKDKITTELMERGIYVERWEVNLWFQRGKIPEDRTLKVLARIFSDALKREVTVSELLGEFELKLREEPDGVAIAEVWKGKKYFGCIRGCRDGIRILSKHFKNRQEVLNRLKFNAAHTPPEILLILGGEND